MSLPPGAPGGWELLTLPAWLSGGGTWGAEGSFCEGGSPFLPPTHLAAQPKSREFPLWHSRNDALRIRIHGNVSSWNLMETISVRRRVRSLVSLSGLEVWCYRELWCRLKTQLGSRVAVAVAVAVAVTGSCSSDSAPGLGSSMCHECGPKKQRQREDIRIQKRGVPWWLSRIHCCPCRGSSSCYGPGLIPGPGTSRCHRQGQKKKKKKAKMVLLGGQVHRTPKICKLQSRGQKWPVLA